MSFDEGLFVRRFRRCDATAVDSQFIISRRSQSSRVLWVWLLMNNALSTRRAPVAPLILSKHQFKKLLVGLLLLLYTCFTEVFMSIHLEKVLYFLCGKLWLPNFLLLTKTARSFLSLILPSSENDTTKHFILTFLFLVRKAFESTESGFSLKVNCNLLFRFVRLAKNLTISVLTTFFEWNNWNTFVSLLLFDTFFCILLIFKIFHRFPISVFNCCFQRVRFLTFHSENFAYLFLSSKPWSLTSELSELTLNEEIETYPLIILCKTCLTGIWKSTCYSLGFGRIFQQKNGSLTGFFSTKFVFGTMRKNNYNFSFSINRQVVVFSMLLYRNLLSHQNSYHILHYLWKCF